MQTKNLHSSLIHRIKGFILTLAFSDCIFMASAIGQDSAKADMGGFVRVKTVKPVAKPEIQLSVEQPADVSPYYRAELYAEVAGKVVFLEKDLGDPVRTGEKIVEIQPSAGRPTNAMSGVIKAPFDGVIASRSVDPGTFVPSAEIVPGAKPLIVIERNDIVTISMKVPDQYSALVNRNTTAEIRMDPLPGRVFKCKISRIAPSLAVGDRTLTVQVDLFNRSEDEFESLKNRFAKDGGAELKSRRLPEFPEGLRDRDSAGLIPGMYGKMKLVFQTSGDKVFIPGSAVQRSGGVDYIYRIENGVARKLRVKIEFDNVAFLSVIIPDKAPEYSVLKPTDEIVISNQSELEDGQRVASTLVGADLKK